MSGLFRQWIDEEWSTEAPLTGADWSFLPEEVIQTMIPNFMSERPATGGRLTVENSEEIEECIRECQALKESNLEFILHADKSPDVIFTEFLRSRGKKLDSSVCREMWEDKINQSMIHIIKEEVRRARPYWIDDRIKPAEGTEKFCYSFPSGHAAGARFIALQLSEKYTELKSDLIKLSERVAWTRVQAGLHFPSDIKAGLMLGETFYLIRK
jgi:hypothetical protein